MIHADRSERIGGAAVAIVLQGAILYALYLGLGITVHRTADSQIALFATAPEPPPPPPVIPPKERTKGKVGAASPANIKSTATEVTAPPPVIPPVQPPPIPAAPKANVGDQTTQGAAPVPGPGTGAGGTGNGNGSGGNGDGDGGGDETPPRLLSGRLRFSDLPPELIDQGIGGTVSVRYAVEANGVVDECKVTRSSGNRLLDQTTCRLIEERFRYKPSLDADGTPVRSYVVEKHSWEVQTLPPDDDRRR